MCVAFLLSLSRWWEKHLWKQLEMHFVWSVLKFGSKTSSRGLVRLRLCGYVIIALIINIKNTCPDSVRPAAASYLATPFYFKVKSVSCFIPYDTWGKVWLFIITHSRCERPGSSSLSCWVDPDPNVLLQLLDLSHASDSPKDNLDNTDLKLQATYENPLRQCEKAQWMCPLKRFPSKQCIADLQLLPYTHCDVVWLQGSAALRSCCGHKQHKERKQTTTKLSRD